MPQHDGLIDLSFAKPGALFSRGENLHRHVASSPLPPPHLSKAALPYDLLQHNSPGYCPLHKQRQTCPERHTHKKMGAQTRLVL